MKIAGTALFWIGIAGSVISPILVFSDNGSGYIAAPSIWVFLISLPVIVIGEKLRKGRLNGSPILFGVGWIGLIISIFLIFNHAGDESHMAEGFISFIIGLFGLILSISMIIAGLVLIIRDRHPGNRQKEAGARELDR